MRNEARTQRRTYAMTHHRPSLSRRHSVSRRSKDARSSLSGSAAASKDSVTDPARTGEVITAL